MRVETQSALLKIEECTDNCILGEAKVTIHVGISLDVASYDG